MIIPLTKTTVFTAAILLVHSDSGGTGIGPDACSVWKKSYLYCSAIANT